MANNYNLSTGVDIVPGSGELADGDTVTATDGTLSNGDEITGDDSNRLILDGAGTFDLTAPGAADGGFITGFNTVEEDSADQSVTLVAGMPVTVTVDDGAGSETVALANQGDSFQGGSTSNNGISVDAGLLPYVTIDGGTGGFNSLILTGTDTLVNLDNASVTDVDNVYVTGNGLTIDPPTEMSVNFLILEGGGNTLTLDSTDPSAIDAEGGNTIVFSDESERLFTLLPTTLAGFTPIPIVDTLIGFDSSDSVTIQNLASLTSATFDSGSDTVTVMGTDSSGNSVDDQFVFRGSYDGSFSVDPDGGGGYDLTYSGDPASDVAVLTGDADNVGSGTSLVIATDGTLTGGDQINPDSGATLELVGAGTFDLTQASALTNIGEITVDSPGADVTLRPGLAAPVTLSSAGDDTVTLANDTVNVNSNDGANDVFNVTPSQVGFVSITGGPFSTLNINNLLDSGTAITLGSNISGIQYVSLDGGASSLDPGQNGPGLVYVEDIDGTGNNTIELTGQTNAAIDYGSSAPDNFFFTPDSGTPQILTIASPDAPADNLYGFDSNSQVVLSAFDNAKPYNVTAASDSGSFGGAPAVLVTITGEDSSGNPLTQNLQLFGDYSTNAADYTLSAIADTSALSLTYSGSNTVDTLNTGASSSISGVSDVYAANNQFNDGGSIATTPGGTLHLVGPGEFDLSNMSITGVTTIDSESGSQVISLDRTVGSPGSPSTGLPVTVNLSGNGHDVLQNLNADSVIDGSYTGNNAGDALSFDINSLNADFGSGGNNQITIDDQDYSLTLDAPDLKNVQTLTIQGDGSITLDTGDYATTSGGPVDINIADGAGTGGADSITLRGNGDSVSDFFGGNNFTLLGPNEIVNDLRNGASLNNPETISGFDQGSSQNDMIAMPFPDTVNGLSSPVINTEADTTTLTLTGEEFGNSYSTQIVLDGIYDGTFNETKISGFGNGWDITYTACYRRGTRILTERGEIEIESLRIGDNVTTLSGASRTIRWIGWRSYAGDVAWGNREVLPILIRKGALGQAVPTRDLWVSPEHAMYIDGMLIPAILLVNGASIVQEERVDEVTYFHLEFDSHELIVAEGALAESFVDDESREMFDNAAEYHQLYPQAARQPAHFCAPRVEEGYELEVVRQHLAARAEMAPSAGDAESLVQRNRIGPSGTELRL